MTLRRICMGSRSRSRSKAPQPRSSEFPDYVTGMGNGWMAVGPDLFPILCLHQSNHKAILHILERGNHYTPSK
jgi:hypothetical protein